MKSAIVKANKKVYTDLMARSMSQRGHNHMAAASYHSVDFSPLAPVANGLPAQANHLSEMFMMHLGCFISQIKVFDKCLKRQPKVIVQAISQTRISVPL